MRPVSKTSRSKAAARCAPGKPAAKPPAPRRSVSSSRPLLPQSPRCLRTENPDDQIDQRADDRDLDRHEEEEPQQPEAHGKKAEEKLQQKQAAQGEQADHEDGAEHGAVSF